MDGPEDPRTRFAAERTLLAWIRTGLALMGFGFVVARFALFLEEVAEAGHTRPPRSVGFSLGIGTALVVLGVLVTVLAAVEHWRILQRLNRAEPFVPSRWSLGLMVAAVLAAFGAAMAAYLMFLGG